MRNPKKILILNTGGTISSIKKEHGYEPAPGYIETALKTIPALQHPDLPTYTIKEYQPLLDSSNMTVSDWNRIGQDITKEYAHYDGFVIFHGTDTMAYTASALSFMLENLAKPVIITGSQIPLSEVRNDALENIITSLWLAGQTTIHEVCIYFNQRLLRGNRTQKISTEDFNAFESPNYALLANVGIHIQLQKNLLRPKPPQAFSFQPITPQFIANFRLFPGFSTEVLAYLLQQNLRGLILETYGAGNAQNNDPKFLQVLTEACARGVIIINCTQCHHGHVEMNQYATGHSLKTAGLISGHYMTLEAAHCKLLYLLSKDLSEKEVKLCMEKNLCGELG